MKVFFENPELLINEFNQMAAIAQQRAFITVGIEIQKEEIQVISDYIKDLNLIKKEFASKKLENEANLVFCIGNSLRVLQYELQMLVNIKEDKMSEAWGSLVNAQVVFGTVVRNYPFKVHFLDGYKERLSSYERLLFPKLHFQSAGGIIKESKCSICNEDFQKCDHIKGKLYMGELCCRIITKMDLEEVSVVENPANKHCRILSIEQNEKKIDVMTLREIDTPANKG